MKFFLDGSPNSNTVFNGWKYNLKTYFVRVLPFKEMHKYNWLREAAKKILMAVSNVNGLPLRKT